MKEVEFSAPPSETSGGRERSSTSPNSHLWGWVVLVVLVGIKIHSEASSHQGDVSAHATDGRSVVDGETRCVSFWCFFSLSKLRLFLKQWGTTEQLHSSISSPPLPLLLLPIAPPVPRSPRRTNSLVMRPLVEVMDLVHSRPRGSMSNANTVTCS